MGIIMMTVKIKWDKASKALSFPQPPAKKLLNQTCLLKVNKKHFVPAFTEITG